MKKMIAVALVATFVSGPAAAQCRPTPGYTCVDRLLFTAAIGYARFGAMDLLNTPNREGAGGNVRADLHIVSFIVKDMDLPVRVSDALSIDMSMGRLTTDTLNGGIYGSEPDGAMTWTFGYHLLAGVQRGKFTVLGGLGWREHYGAIGGATFEATTRPLIGRIEFGDRKPIFLTAMVGVSGDNSTGLRLDVPLFRRLDMTADYWRVDGRAELWNNAGGKTPAAQQSLMFGVRTRELK